jgi:hypothetical protein
MRVEFDGERRTITVNGIAISLEVLEMMTRPDPRRYLRFERRDGSVTVTSYQFESMPPEGVKLRRCDA